MGFGDWYKLDADRNPVRCENHMEYFLWHQSQPKESATGIGLQLAKTRITENISVSTVFLGSDHAYRGTLPELWETMIFGGERDEEIERYNSWGVAMAGHERIVGELQKVSA